MIRMRAGRHYWAIADGKAVVVLSDGERCYPAGAWEGAIPVDRVVAEIPEPEEVRDLDPYYRPG